MSKIAKKTYDDSIPFGLHESYIIDISIKEDKMIFRFAIDCYINEKLNIDCSEEDLFYLFDLVCYNHIIYESNLKDEDNILMKDILVFKKVDNKYLLYIFEDWDESIDIIFNCEKMEWIPIKVMNFKELAEIENTEYCKI